MMVDQMLLSEISVLHSLQSLAAERFANNEDADLQNILAEGMRAMFAALRGVAGTAAIDELHVEGFHHDQVWAMMKMEHEPLMERLEKEVARLGKLKSEELRLIDDDENNDDDDDDDDDDDEDDNDDDEDDDEDDNDDDENDDEAYGEDDDEDDESVASFEAAKRFRGARSSMVFKVGAQGLGYYRDVVVSKGKLCSKKKEVNGKAKSSKKVSFQVEEKSDEDESEEESEGCNDDISTELDDDFFKLSNMEKFTESVEAEDLEAKQHLDEARRAAKNKKSPFTKKDEDDYSDDGEEEDEEKDEYDLVGDEDEEIGANIKAKDFWGFNSKKKQQRKERRHEKPHDEIEIEEQEENEMSEDGACDEELSDESDSPPPELSTHEKRQFELRQQIEELEAEAMRGKTWELTGETHGHARPANSLLEKGDLDVEYLSTPAPTITEESTKSLEDIICQRILDNDFDDVVRVLPMAKDADYQPKVELSMEKSKAGLAEEYEKEYEEKFMGRTPEEVSKRDAEQKELHDIFVELCGKLDSLSNFHYTPKTAATAGSVTPVGDVAAVQMEEVIPLTESSANALAPEEVMAKQKGRSGVGKSTEEMDQDECRTARQAKKAAKRSRKRMRDMEKKIVSKLKPGLGNKHAKQQILDQSTRASAGDNVNWTKSSDVFKRLQSAQENPNQAAAKAFKSSKSLNDAAKTSKKPSAAFKL